jgi:hypothetical protein
VVKELLARRKPDLEAPVREHVLRERAGGRVFGIQKRLR